jgi:mycofactocin precursor
MEDADNRDGNCEPTETEDDCNPDILEEIEIEDLTVDGICGVY